MADDIRIPIPAPSLSNSNTLPPKAIGVPCKNVSGRMKMMMFHPSQPNTRLNYCADVLDHIKSYGFAENIESGTPDTIEFMYDAFPGIEITGDCPTPKLPRSKIDGLHPYTYKAFLDALSYYLPRERPQELFILRYAPSNRDDEKDGRRWNLAELSGRIFVYVENSLDIDDYNRYHQEED